MLPIVAPPSPGKGELLKTIRRDLAASRAGEWQAASCWRRWLMRWQIERAARAELRRRFPPGALYGRAV
jgi:hypothetical protein